ncbi:hypothetical protein SAY86_010363 [Trapa natans]|uniref:Uncharacterized protein n=1 Tax=Trapa natans TaxID=22666 RepID=A0AAN7R377_TRANT|nr:hypothetical protein SAY86_010363 [Trapa natans]
MVSCHAQLIIEGYDQADSGVLEDDGTEISKITVISRTLHYSRNQNYELVHYWKIGSVGRRAASCRLLFTITVRVLGYCRRGTLSDRVLMKTFFCSAEIHYQFPDRRVVVKIRCFLEEA